ncbi:uncharacterized protein LOC118182093 isoform X2 [Stegodyphus dumicola]|uniref:uncharacterized protein LOC118182093 isoform X2 n=1 Tax=Stegodyphus dumicola TaxID=202533 RepID=UPI0015AEA8FA|nr:uncharacterized protein LOC118182093 isoform X2 [Stegodyphus dumicola]
MGVGSSANNPRPGTTVMVASKRPQTSISGHSVLSSERSNDHRSSEHHDTSNRPTNSCCSHFRENHAAATRTVTPVTRTAPTNGSIDDEIEEIVANTLDLTTNTRNSRQSTSVARDNHSSEETNTSTEGVQSTSEHQRTLQSGSNRIPQKRSSSDEIDAENDSHYDAKDAVPEVDFAKFKKVNHKGATLQKNGRIIHHQESDLLWRLGLISPEAYKITTGTRSAPSNQGPYLKTPSYDLTEEQLMANIEKEFELTTAM